MLLKEKKITTKRQLLISIISVSYNAALTIESSILSVVKQNYPFIEYIIIDGDSSDGTVEIIKKYADKISYWISEPDKGIYDAMNKGVTHASGDYILFLGADDTLYSLSILNDIHKYLVNKNTIYYGNVMFVPSQTLYGGKMNKLKFCLKNINHQSIFYPRKVFEYYSYETQYRIYADYYLNLMCFLDAKFNFQYIDCIVSNFCEQGSSSSVQDIAFDKDFFILIKQRFGFLYFLYSKVILFIYQLRKNSGTF
jgi:glycosyltransferase involved in cell wall biosynthesis